MLAALTHRYKDVAGENFVSGLPHSGLVAALQNTAREDVIAVQHLQHSHNGSKSMLGAHHPILLMRLAKYLYQRHLSLKVSLSGASITLNAFIVFIISCCFNVCAHPLCPLSFRRAPRGG
jgi:hypothetical protein